MDTRRIWFSRRFQLGLPVEALPDIVERLRGTPARLEERIHSVRASQLNRRVGESWSIQENAGHLLDLEALWNGRVSDFLEGAAQLRAADLANQRTWDANYNAQPIAGVLATFRSARMALVARLEQFTTPQLRVTSLHPRLQQPMTIVDHAFFVAEHDDHHLARITDLLRGDAAI